MGGATLSERRKLLASLLDGVYVDAKEDQARVALFLAPSDSDYMVGQYLLVNGEQGITTYPPPPGFSPRL